MRPFGQLHGLLLLLLASCCGSLSVHAADFDLKKFADLTPEERAQIGVDPSTLRTLDFITGIYQAMTWVDVDGSRQPKWDVKPGFLAQLDVTAKAIIADRDDATLSDLGRIYLANLKGYLQQISNGDKAPLYMAQLILGAVSSYANKNDLWKEYGELGMFLLQPEIGEAGFESIKQAAALDAYGARDAQGGISYKAEALAEIKTQSEQAFASQLQFVQEGGFDFDGYEKARKDSVASGGADIKSPLIYVLDWLASLSKSASDTNLENPEAVSRGSLSTSVSGPLVLLANAAAKATVHEGYLKQQVNSLGDILSELSKLKDQLDGLNKDPLEGPEDKNTVTSDDIKPFYEEMIQRLQESADSALAVMADTLIPEAMSAAGFNRGAEFVSMAETLQEGWVIVNNNGDQQQQQSDEDATGRQKHGGMEAAGSETSGSVDGCHRRRRNRRMLLESCKILNTEEILGAGPGSKEEVITTGSDIIGEGSINTGIGTDVVSTGTGMETPGGIIVTEGIRAGDAMETVASGGSSAGEAI